MNEDLRVYNIFSAWLLHYLVHSAGGHVVSFLCMSLEQKMINIVEQLS